MDFEEMKKQLASRLKKSRYLHSLGVADTAAFLAERFHLDVQQARVAGLLHDCAREFSNDALCEEADKRGLKYGEVERSMPILLHAYVGARWAEESYGVHDPVILQAIYRHTVGGPNMSELDKIIYLADMIEPRRDYPGVESLRRMTETASLDDMLLDGLSQSILFVVKKGHLIHPDTVLARNEILLKDE